MKLKKLWLVAATVAATVGVGGHAEAGREPQPTTANVVGPVVVDRDDPTVAYMWARYRCYGEGTLWVSVKQVEDRSKDQRLSEEGSSAISAAWSMSHRNTVDCDGRVHVQRFTLDQIETAGFGIPPSPLERGWGFVQFCLFDDNFPLPTDPESFGNPFYDYGFHRVL
jgi:hypothetical protein